MACQTQRDDDQSASENAQAHGHTQFLSQS